MSALADRMPAERISPLLKEPREVTARDRLELLCDPGSLHVIRSTVLSIVTVLAVLPAGDSRGLQSGGARELIGDLSAADPASRTRAALMASEMACRSRFPGVVGVTGRYSNRQITQLAAQLLDWALVEARVDLGNNLTR